MQVDYGSVRLSGLEETILSLVTEMPTEVCRWWLHTQEWCKGFVSEAAAAVVSFFVGRFMFRAYLNVKMRRAGLPADGALQVFNPSNPLTRREIFGMLQYIGLEAPLSADIQLGIGDDASPMHFVIFTLCRSFVYGSDMYNEWVLSEEPDAKRLSQALTHMSMFHAAARLVMAWRSA